MKKKSRIEDIYPLSPMQEGMLFHSLREPHSGIYFEQVFCTLVGELEVGVLERAWQRVVDRHPSLRTAFVWERRDEPFQVVFKEVRLRWEHHDWRGMSAEDREQLFQELIEADRRRGFELSKPPLTHLCLLRLAEDAHRLLWSCHHLLIDGWSQNQIIREVSACYQAFSEGREPRLEPSPSYSRYVAWLRRQDMGRAESFWRRGLQGFSAATPLGVDHPPGRISTEADLLDGEHEVRLDAESTARLQELAQGHRLTANTFVQGAWALLLHRYSGAADVVFGATVAGRPSELPGIDTMTGLFVNTLPLRVRVVGDEEALPWLIRLRHQQAEIGQYEYTPLAQIQRWSEVPAGQPLFESILVFENYPMDETLLDWGPRLAIRDVRNLGKTNYPVSAVAYPGRRLGLWIFYDRRRFEKTAVERLARHWSTLLEGLIRDPHQRLAEVPLLAAGERQQLMAEWNDTRVELPPQPSIHALFEAQAARTPAAPAVLAAAETLSYGELDARANRLARLLRRLGVGPEDRVGVCLERSAAMLVALLAALKADGAYVPLDPSYPRERLNFMASDAGISVLVLAAGSPVRLSAGSIPRVKLDAGGRAEDQGALPDTSPPSAVGPHHLAYVMYTSGSTGLPKGVEVPHAGVLRLVSGADYVTLDGRQTLLQAAPMTFDASTLEVWGALLHGGRCVLMPDRIPTAPSLRSVIREHGIDTMWLTASLFNAVVDEDPEALRGVSQLLIGGEALSVPHVRKYREIFPDTALVNGYGPTESTTFTCCHRIPARLDSPGSIPIGRPIVNTRVYVLDRHLQPVGLGIVGELLIGGLGLARGYLRRAALTAERFIPDPWSGQPGARLYRTGDLVRWRAPGHVGFLGRSDQQVKVRGHRIELGEIETVLKDHPAVAEAVVLAREDQPGHRRLVGYLTPAGDEQPSTDELRGFLERWLPVYMLPASFLTLAELPLTTSGKVDRRALPAPERLRPGLEKAHVEPRTPVESLLAEIWCEVLGLERVGVEDDFFELGGDSIVSIRVVSKARQKGLVITPRQAFEHPTIAGLAAVAEIAAPRAADRGPVVGEAPLSPVQRWFFEQRLVDPEHWNHAVLLRPRRAVDAATLAGAFGHLLRHHDALRLRFVPRDGGMHQRYSDPSPAVPFVQIDLRALPAGAEQRGLAATLDQLQTGFDLERGPLARAAWLDLAGDPPGRLLIAAHHLVVDMVSWRVLLEDFETLCRQLRRQEVRLPPKTTSFKVWTEHLTAWVGSEDLEATAAHWRQAPGDVLRLPLDFPAGDNRHGSARTLSQSLTGEETRSLLQEVPAAYRTRIDEVLLTALARAVRPWMGGGPLWIDLEGHGRETLFENVDLSRTVGWFTSLYPVALGLPEDTDEGVTIKAVKEQLRRVPWHGLGHGVQRYLARSESVRDLPPAEISFNYLGQLDEALPASALFELAPEPAGAMRSRRGARSHRLEVSGSVVDGRLKMEWTYSENLHRRETIEGLARRFLHSLRSLIGHCRSPESFGYTPSDFPLAGLDQETLDRLVADVGRVEDLYPLAPIQQGLLFHSLSEPTLGEYVVQFVCRFERPLDVGGLRRAWQEVLARQPVLRTSFRWQGLSAPLQVVHRSVALPWQEIDWRAVPAEQRDERLAAWLEEDRRCGFEILRAPLLRLTLIRLDEDVHQFVWSLHHVLMDGWSLSVLLKDVFAFYDAGLQGQGARVSAHRPYRDYIAWLGRQDLERAETFWRNLLEGFSSATPVGLGRGAGEARHRELGSALSATVGAELETLARRHQLTLNTLVLGAWSLLLGHLAGQRDVVFGVTVSGRPPELEGVESIVGLFINTLPVRVRLPASEAVVPWLQALQKQQVELRQFEHSPLAEVQKWSDVPAGQELFESLLVFENYPVDAAVREAVAGLGSRDVRSIERTHYPLNLIAEPGRELGLRISCDERRFDRLAVRRMMDQLQRLLSGLPSGVRLGELSWLNAAERHQLTVGWNDTRVELPPQPSIHALFEAQAVRTPAAPAVVAADGTLSYGELDARANRLAHRLRRLGVGADDRVGICLERSVAMLVASLATLKADGAYVPLDPSYPSERLDYMTADSGISVLVSTASSPAPLSAGSIPRVTLDAGGRAEDDETLPETSPPSVVGPHHLAYVMYTSGSTGLPKGVEIPHAGVLRLVWEADYVTLDGRQTLLQAASMAFDASTLEVWGALLHGGRCVLMPAGTPTAGSLRSVIGDHGVDTMWLTASLFNAVVDEDPEALRGVGQLLIGGEALSVPHVRKYRESFPDTALINGYGPTESTTFTCCYAIPARLDSAASIPIGRPIVNTWVYVLDRDLQPVGLGIVGELCIGGLGLARGYQRRPALTAEKFVPDSAGEIPGTRLYRTGDLVRYQGDGAIEFLGRTDHQIKIRGFRVELGEIEVALAEHPAVAEAVVLARDDRFGHKQLVGYLTAKGDQTPTTDGLRDFLKRRLPGYMLPTVFVTLAELPLTASGKVHRKALPAPERLRPDLGKAYVEPRTPVESLLAEIWCEALGLERLGVEDDFFELGGDSIVSIRVVSEARQKGLAITPKQAFEHPTIAGLAAVAEVAAPRVAGRGPVTGEAPPTPVQRWFFEQQLVAPEHWNQAVLLRPRRAVDVATLNAAFSHLYVHHDALRLRFVPRDGDVRQRYSDPPAIVPFVRIDLRALSAGAEARGLAAAHDQLQTGFDLEHGPLAQAAWLDLADDPPGRLLIVAHHLVVDVVSWRILLEDLESLCQQLRRRREVLLPPKTSSFKTWAEGLTAWAGSEELAAQTAYWRRPLGDIPHLPLDSPGGDNHQSSARTVSRSLTAEETRALVQEVPAAYRTRIDEVLLTALLRTVRPWMGGGTLWIDLEGHGREALFEDVDLSRTVGWFTTIFPLALELPEGADEGAALKAVKEQLRRVPQHGVGYGVLRYLAGDEAVCDLPLAEISFNYLGQLDEVLPREAFFELAPEPAGATRSLRGTRSHRLEVSGSVLNGRLTMEWTYSENLHRRETIEDLARQFLHSLRSLIAHCSSPENFGYSPSDFPLAGLDQETLDRLVADEGRVEDLYPLAPIQQGLLFHSLSAPTLGEYFVQFTCRFERPLDAGSFRRAWEETLRYQPVLRTSFRWQGLSVPLQVVHRSVALPWQEIDWRAVPAEQRDERLAAWLEEDRRCGFEIRQAPLLRLTLIRLDEDVHQFVWSLHHVLMDGWSLSVLLKGAFAFYDAGLQGQEARVSAHRPYRDYIAWLGRQDLERAETFWRNLLEGFSSATPVGLDRGSGEARHRELRSALSATVGAELEALARRHQLTLNTLVLGAWGLLLGHLAGQRDVVFGVTVSGRPPELEGVESIVGLFINTLPVRVRLPASEAVVPWLQALQKQQVELRQFEHSPLAEVQKWSDVPAGQELFESLMVFENYPVDAAVREAVAGLGCHDVRSIERTHYPLNLIAEPGRELGLRISCDERRFDRLAVRRMMDQLQRLLRGLPSGVRLGELPWLSPAERQQLLVEWNATATEYDRTTLIHYRVEARAARHGDSPAVELGTGEDRQWLTYRQLDERANRLAQRLRALGIGPEDRVALWLERSPDLIVAQLATLKAGGAYVPLDPAWPNERLEFVLRDTGAPVVLTQESLAVRLPRDGARILRLDGEREALAREIASSPSVPATAGQLAYVIYTSGSTGRPKGVEVTHASLANLIAWHQRVHGVTAADRATQLTGLAFDASVWEVWPYLTAGACLCMPCEGNLAQADQLIEYLARQKVTISFLPTPLAELAMQESWPPEASLRRLLTGGDKLHFAPREGFSWRLVNQYGPTESTVVATWAEVGAGLPGAPPVGRPIDNVQTYVLDRELQPVPVGVPGELVIGGDGLARGYLRRPALTAEKFVPDPFGDTAGGRLYCTGDLARHRGDGEIEFMGRIDHQVKVRGFRIELGEIEVALGEHQAVREAVVLSREDAPGEKRLVGYIVAMREPAPTVNELRAFLRQRLPDYMVPAAFVVLDELPLTPNRKVDRRALPAPESMRPELAQEYVAPRTPEEERLAAIWAEVLKLDRVGRQDNFFELGGDSILSIQVVARAAEVGLRLTPKQLFEHPTVGELAAVAGAAGERLGEQGPVTGEVLLTPIQRWFFDLRLPRPEQFNMALLLTVAPELDAGVLASAARQVAAHHDALHLRFSRRSSGGWRQEHAPPEPLTVAEIDLGALAPEARGAAIAAIAERQHGGLDLERGPLVRMTWFQFGEGEPGRLLIIVHHLVMDVVSWRILLQDLAAACEQLRRGEAVELPPKSTSFQSWAERLAEHARSAALDPESEYWTAPARQWVDSLPRDEPGGANVEASARTVAVALTEDETAALVRQAPRAYRMRVDEVLLTALARTLREVTGSGSALIDVEGHGREELFEEVDLSRTVGWFTTLTPIFLELPPGDDEAAALKAVKEQLRRVPHRGIGHGLLRYLRQDSEFAAELEALPSPEVSFNYLGQLDQGMPESSLFAPAPEAIGSGRDPQAPRTHVLGVNCSVAGGRLRIELNYSALLHHQATVEDLAQRCQQHLKDLIAHCRSTEGGFTPSDFSLVEVDQEKLDKVVARFSRKRRRQAEDGRREDRARLE